ncbi:MAG: DUF3685 domain-containing protein [Cyanobacteriota bacterium]|nr:DUF3685 domain-containing protein [Cyanobacteriota bacterium]
MSAPALQLLSIDSDPIFRMGLRGICEQFPDLQLVAEAPNAAAALRILEGAIAESEVLPTKTVTADTLDAIVWDVESCNPELDESEKFSPAIAFCQQLKTLYPNLPILVLTNLREASVLAALREAGVEGYCPKGVAIDRLVTAIRQVGGAQSYWLEIDLPLPHASPFQSRTSKVLKNIRFHLGKSGLRQIDRALSEANSDLEDCQESFNQNDLTSVLNLAITRGRRRELVTARWIVSQLLPNSADRENGLSGNSESGDRPPSENADYSADGSAKKDSQNPAESLAIRNENESALTVRYPVRGTELQSVLFDATAARLRSSSLLNLSGMPLEIDILRLAKKRELIYIVLQKLEEILAELRFARIQPAELSQKRSYILGQLWEEALRDFVGKSYKLKGSESYFFFSDIEAEKNSKEIEIVPLLLRDAQVVREFILEKIPLVEDLLGHLLFQFPLVIDNVSFGPGTIEAMQRAATLLQNLILQVANAVMQPLLNNLADVEDIKKSFYDRNLISTREIERFRNSLSWQYRLREYVEEPKAIFESGFWLFALNDSGIQKVLIYAPRRQELAKLSGLQLTVTLVLETRDAIAPGVRAVISFMGSGVVYLLTQVVGRGIGLIGRGIIQGIGNSMQDVKFGKSKK